MIQKCVPMPAQTGMCTEMDNESFFRLMTTNSKGVIQPALVAMTIKFYPELIGFVKPV